MYIRSLAISNLRSIAESSLVFSCPEDENGNVTLLLGGNGSGKTSILRAVALASLGPALRESGFLPYRLVRESARSRGRSPARCTIRAEVVLSKQDAADRQFGAGLPLELTTVIERAGKGANRRERVSGCTASRGQAPHEDLTAQFERLLFRAELNRFVVVGYGATRRIEAAANIDTAARAKSRGPRYQRVAGLFEEGATLIPLSFWLPEFQRRNPGRAKQVTSLINRLLPAGCELHPKVAQSESGPEFMFRMHDTPVTFGALSDGYRAYVGWIADLLFHITQGAASGKRLDQTEGIVLVDEIDLHLHPEWQRAVLPTLASALPALQFVVTSHSPLVTASLLPAQVRVLDIAEHGTEIRTIDETLEGRSVDQILRSPYFNLESTRNLKVESALRRLFTEAMDGDVQASLNYLRELTGTDEKR